jgi:hypothetical protein
MSSYKRCIEEGEICVFANIKGDYDYNESCLKICEPNVSTDPICESGILIRDILNEDFIRKKNEHGGNAVIEFSAFHRNCGLNEEIVLFAIYARLAVTEINKYERAYKDWRIDLNTLAWMVWHQMGNDMYMHCVDFKQKNNSSITCVICNGVTNITTTQSCFITLSPEQMSGDRTKMNLDGEDVHFVKWSFNHDTDIESFYKNMMRDETPRRLVYVHSSMQYGHPHVHIMSGNYHNVRVLEMLRRMRSMIKKGLLIRLHDFYLPIDKFYRNCDKYGRKVLIACIFLVRYRLNISLSDMLFVDFITTSYAFAASAIKKNISYYSHIADMSDKSYDCQAFDRLEQMPDLERVPEQETI